MHAVNNLSKVMTCLCYPYDINERNVCFDKNISATEFVRMNIICEQQINKMHYRSIQPVTSVMLCVFSSAK